MMPKKIVLLALLLAFGAHASLVPDLSKAQANIIGAKIWQNECGKSIDKLVWWNEGESFASVGIGHFLWYPQGIDAPFEQTFPALVQFMRQQGQPIPPWLHGSCPWKIRSEFLAANDPRVQELRSFLHATIDLQTQFMLNRLKQSLHHLLHNAPPKQRRLLKQRLARLTQTPHGLYVLMDYINFKGDGTQVRERYNGNGWGLLQVLNAMGDVQSNPDACRVFANAARHLLEQRVQNAPPERNERRWLAGWLERLNTYLCPAPF